MCSFNDINRQKRNVLAENDRWITSIILGAFEENSVSHRKRK